MFKTDSSCFQYNHINKKAPIKKEKFYLEVRMNSFNKFLRKSKLKMIKVKQKILAL